MKTNTHQSLKWESGLLNSTVRIAKTSLLLIVLCAGLFALPGCEKDEDTSPLDSAEYAELNGAMRKLWSDHMEWTYKTVDAFYNNSDALTPSLNRLLQNQKDIGAAIVPYYGQAAGDTLTSLLTTHINQAVPVLTAAQNNDQAALDAALAAWNANAKEIADFLSAANPDNWPTSATEHMMQHHIETTTSYAVNILAKNYEQAIIDYDEAYAHMMELADVLSEGIAKQFPDKF